MCNDLSQEFFENMFQVWNNCSKFRENSSGKKASVWTDFRNSFMWLTGIKKWFLTFLDLVIYWSFLKISWIKKMTRIKKVIKVKNQFFHARQPREGTFKIHSYWGLIFTTVFLNFEQLFRIGETFFQKKLLPQIITSVYNFLSGYMKRTF